MRRALLSIRPPNVVLAVAYDLGQVSSIRSSVRPVISVIASINHQPLITYLRRRKHELNEIC